ncbi:MAG: hypothetical protein JRF63_12465 [Deltaproteobacteria bacterium]|nr:hypothetical protein [Deltaproteobacteria bacterium]
MRWILMATGLLMVFVVGCGGDKQEVPQPAAERVTVQPAAEGQPSDGVQLRSVNDNTQRQIGTKLNLQQQRTRQTPKTDFGSKLEEGLGKATDEALQKEQVAQPYLPSDSLNAPTGN